MYAAVSFLKSSSGEAQSGSKSNAEKRETEKERRQKKENMDKWRRDGKVDSGYRLRAILLSRSSFFAFGAVSRARRSRC